MKEQLISFETAKLAKEKGFEVKCSTYKIHLPYSKENPCYIPTQSLLQKWLREEHNLHISVDNNNYEIKNMWCYDIHKLPYGLLRLWKRGEKTYSSYEEALEKGLQEALKLIK